MVSMRPCISLMTCSAQVGEGEPEILAEGAAIATPAAEIRALAIGCEGQRTATESSPPVTSSGTISFLGIITVKGPGINALASLS